MALIKCLECGNQISDHANCCPHCGSPVKGITICPNCGKEVNEGKFCTSCGVKFNGNEAKINGLALAGGITGICSLFIDFIGLVAITAIVLSAVGLNQISKTGIKGKGWAITGLVCGIIELVFKFIVLLNYY